jgi:uncharacterized membrane protein
LFTGLAERVCGATAQQALDTGEANAHHLRHKQGEVMASVAASSADRSVSVGRVLDRAFGTVRHNPSVTFGLAFIFGLIPAVLSAYVFGTASDDNPTSIMNVALIFVSSLVSIVISGLTQAAVTRATVAHSEGRRASFRESLAAGMAVLGPVVLLSLLFGVAVSLGFALLIVPGVILYVMWSVATAVLVEERRSVTASLARSRVLTRGARWTVFGILLLMTAIYFLTFAVVEVVSGWSTGVSYFASEEQSFGFLLSSGIVGLLMNLLWGVVLASLFVELRNWKDGPDPQGLADVFA